MNAGEELLEYALFRIVEEAAKLALCPKKAMQNLASLSSCSEKLVYLFLCITQPQTFTGMRRVLGMNKTTLSRTLKKLQKRGLITIGDDFLYWIVPFCGFLGKQKGRSLEAGRPCGQPFKAGFCGACPAGVKSRRKSYKLKTSTMETGENVCPASILM